jgi:hypothetical protein
MPEIASPNSNTTRDGTSPGWSPTHQVPSMSFHDCVFDSSGRACAADVAISRAAIPVKNSLFQINLPPEANVSTSGHSFGSRSFHSRTRYHLCKLRAFSALWRLRSGPQSQPIDPEMFRTKAPRTFHTNHDALEFPDGEIVLLTRLYEGQNATVLTLPTQPNASPGPSLAPRRVGILTICRPGEFLIEECNPALVG